jgi:hypothetical protein
MTIGVLKNVRIFAGGIDLTGRSNKVGLEPEYEQKDVTTFGSVDANGDVWQELIAGLGSGKLSGSGFNEYGAGGVDETLFGRLGGLDAWTVCPVNGAVGAVAYLTDALEGSYQQGGAVGDVNPWSASLSTSKPIARGGILHPPGTARTATGTGTIVDLATVGMGSIPDGKGLYASLHVLSVSGTSTPTLTAAVQTAATVGFGSPTTRITFPAYTAAGGQRLSVAGPITDQYARVSFTISGDSPSFLFVCAVGIANA